MQLDTISIDEFSQQDVYPCPDFQLDSETTLLYGPNNAGKTLTFCAIGYAVLQRTWETPTGNSAKVTAAFSNGLEYTASAGGHRLDTTDQTYRSSEAEEQLSRRIGSQRFLQHYFIHSRVAEFPLRDLSPSNLLGRIRDAAAPDVQEEIENWQTTVREHEAAIGELRQQKQTIEDRLLPTATQRIEELEARIEEEERIIALGDAGELTAVRDTLEAHADVDAELQDLYERRRELESDLSELRHRREHVTESESTPDEKIPVEGISRDCPACGVTVPRREARRRAAADRCPVCDRDTDTVLRRLSVASDLVGSDDGGEEVSDVEELDEKIDDHETERAEVENRIADLQSEQPGLSELDDEVQRRLQRYDRQIDVVVATAREQLDDLTAELEQLRAQRDDLETGLQEADDELTRRTEQCEEAREQSREYQREARDAVDEFEDRWTRTFRRLSPTLGVEVRVQANDGIVLPGESARTYGANLSEAERLLLNLSFGITLEETLDDERAPFSTFVLDDPLVHLDEDVAEEVLSFIEQDDDRQYVVTTSNETATDSISNVERLARQPSLDAFSDESDDGVGT